MILTLAFIEMVASHALTDRIGASAIDDFVKACVVGDQETMAAFKQIDINDLPRWKARITSFVPPYTTAYQRKDDEKILLMRFQRPAKTSEVVSAGCSVILRGHNASAAYDLLVDRLGKLRVDYRLIKNRYRMTSDSYFGPPSEEQPDLLKLSDDHHPPRGGDFRLVSLDNKKLITFRPLVSGYNELSIGQQTKYAVQY